jgi:hypothetical protein
MFLGDATHDQMWELDLRIDFTEENIECKPSLEESWFLNDFLEIGGPGGVSGEKREPEAMGFRNDARAQKNRG